MQFLTGVETSSKILHGCDIRAIITEIGHVNAPMRRSQGYSWAMLPSGTQRSATLPSQVGPRVAALLCVGVTGQFLCNLFTHFVVVDGPVHLPLYVDVCHYINKFDGFFKSAPFLRYC